MKLAYWEFSDVICTDNRKYNTLVIENRELMLRFLSDIYRQIGGIDGKSIVSHNNKPLQFSKSVEVIDRFIDFDINSKALLSKILSRIETAALNEENYLKSIALINEISNYITELSFDLPCSLNLQKLSISSLLKSTGIEVESDGGVAERISDYMELVTELDRHKLFISVNMRSFINDNEMENFVETVINHEYDVLAVENKAYDLLTNEKRIIIDNDLCEIHC